MYPQQYQYQSMPQPYHQETVTYQPSSQPPAQNQPVAPEQKRKKAILQIVDPTTKKAIDVTSSHAVTSAVVPPPTIAPEVAEKKEQFSREFMDKVKKGKFTRDALTVIFFSGLKEESQGKSPNPHTASAPVMSFPNFSVPPPALGQNPNFAPLSGAPQKTFVHHAAEQNTTEQANAEPVVPQAAILTKDSDAYVMILKLIAINSLKQFPDRTDWPR